MHDKFSLSCMLCNTNLGIIISRAFLHAKFRERSSTFWCDDVIRENKVEVAPPMDLSRFLHDPVQLYGRSNAYQKKLDQYGPDYSSYCRVELFRAKNNDREGPASSKETTTAKEMLKQTVGKQTGKTRSVGGARGAPAPQVEDGSGSGPPSETESRKPSTESALRGSTAANGKNSTSSSAMLRRGDKKLSNTSGKTNSSTGINSSSEQRPQSISKKEERKMKQKEKDLQIADNRVALEKSSLYQMQKCLGLEEFMSVMLVWRDS